MNSKLDFSNYEVISQENDPQIQYLVGKIIDLKLTAPVVFLLESMFPLRQTAFCCSEFCAPIGELFFKNSYQVFQKLLSSSEQYQDFLSDLEKQTQEQRNLD